MGLFILAALAVAAVFPEPAGASFYNCVNRPGIMASIASQYPTSPLFQPQHLRQVFASAAKYNVDPRLVLAIAGHETRFGTAATLPTGQSATTCRNGNNFWRWGGCDSDHRFPDGPNYYIPNGVDRAIDRFTMYLRQGFFKSGGDPRQLYKIAVPWSRGGVAEGEEDLGEWVGGVGYWLAIMGYPHPYQYTTLELSFYKNGLPGPYNESGVPEGMDCLYGDCNLDGSVSVPEVITGVGVQLNGASNQSQVDSCQPALIPARLIRNQRVPAQGESPYVYLPVLAANSILYGYAQPPGPSPLPTLTSTPITPGQPTATPVPTSTPQATNTPVPPAPQPDCYTALLDPAFSCPNTDLKGSIFVSNNARPHVTSVVLKGNFGDCALQAAPGIIQFSAPNGCATKVRTPTLCSGQGFGFDIVVSFSDRPSCTLRAAGRIALVGCGLGC